MNWIQHICSVNEVDWLEIRGREAFMKGVRILAGTRGICLTEPRPAVGLTLLPLQWVPGGLSLLPVVAPH